MRSTHSLLPLQAGLLYPASAMPLLKIEDIHFTYPSAHKPALRGVDMNVDRGEIVALAGPNACGKTTLALLLKGFLKPARGCIRIKGADEAANGLRPHVGLLFSNPENQLVTTIVEEDVAFALETAGRPPREIRAEVDRVLQRLGIDHLRNRSPHRLSGGEQQMAALAGVLVSKPDILILDEPTAYLDPPARLRVMDTLADLAREGMAVLLITHDMEEAAQAGRMAVMVEGRIEALDVPESIFVRGDLLSAARLKPPFALRSHFPAGGISREETGGRAGDISLAYEEVSFAHRIPGGENGGCLRDITTRLRDGTVRILCGANGAGKSTLIQLGNGLLRPALGRVTFRGLSLDTLKHRRGHTASAIGLLFQKPERQLFEETVAEDVAFGPRNLGLDRHEIKRRVSAALEWVGLAPEVWERSPATLSGGQLRRSAIAGVLALEPQVLLLDEPTDGLDPLSADRFWARLRYYVKETGTGVILATHRVPDQVASADGMDMLVDGRLAATGSAAEVLVASRLPVDDIFLPEHLRRLRQAGVPAEGKVDISEAAVNRLLHP